MSVCKSLTRKGIFCTKTVWLQGGEENYCYHHKDHPIVQVEKNPCKMKTSRGTACKREAKSGELYCFVHCQSTVSFSSIIAEEKTLAQSSVVAEKNEECKDQCRSLTIKGNRCIRKTYGSSNYCKTHISKFQNSTEKN